MAENSHIEWTHHTFNPWRGCTKVSEGCKFCYAETLSARNHATLGVWGPKGSRPIAVESYWRQPLKWQKKAFEDVFAYLNHLEAYEEGLHEMKPVRPIRPRVFCASLADVFEGRDTMPKDSWNAVEDARARLFALIEKTPNLDWLLLTKRPENVLTMVPAGIGSQMRFPDNLWIGTSVEDQKTANERIPHLLQVPAKVRFLSCEPLLGPVSLNIHLSGCGGSVFLDCLRGIEEWGTDDESDTSYSENHIDWVIVGGESGKNARPMHPDWARSLRDQCQAAGVPFLFKQWGEWSPYPAHSHQDHGHVFDDWTKMYRVGKSRAGRTLDGKIWDEYPERRKAMRYTNRA